jgi:hypothetical protein
MRQMSIAPVRVQGALARADPVGALRAALAGAGPFRAPAGGNVNAGHVSAAVGPVDPPGPLMPATGGGDVLVAESIKGMKVTS